MVVDHVLPLALNGSSDLSNLAPACRDCNADKHDLSVDEWRAKREQRDQPWPPRRYGDIIRERLQAHMTAHPCDGTHLHVTLLNDDLTGL